MNTPFRPLVQPRLLLDDDGHNVFSTLSTDYRKDIDEAVALIQGGYHARMVNVENEQAEDVIINANIKIWEFP